MDFPFDICAQAHVTLKVTRVYIPSDSEVDCSLSSLLIEQRVWVWHHPVHHKCYAYGTLLLPLQFIFRHLSLNIQETIRMSCYWILIVIFKTEHNLTWYLVLYSFTAALCARSILWVTMYGSVAEFPAVQFPNPGEQRPGAWSPRS